MKKIPINPWLQVGDAWCKENQADRHKSRARSSVSQGVRQSIGRCDFPTFELFKNAKRVKWDQRTDGRTDRTTQ